MSGAGVYPSRVRSLYPATRTPVPPGSWWRALGFARRRQMVLVAIVPPPRCEWILLIDWSHGRPGPQGRGEDAAEAAFSFLALHRRVCGVVGRRNFKQGMLCRRVLELALRSPAVESRCVCASLLLPRWCEPGALQSENSRVIFLLSFFCRRFM